MGEMGLTAHGQHYAAQYHFSGFIGEPHSVWPMGYQITWSLPYKQLADHN